MYTYYKYKLQKIFNIILNINLYNRRYIMRPIDRLYRKDDIVSRSLHIDEELYLKIQDLSDNVFNASVSKIVNICVETMLLDKDNIKYYKKPQNTESIYRSILFKKSFYDELVKIRAEKGISFSRLVNGSIKQFLDKYKKEF